MRPPPGLWALERVEGTGVLFLMSPPSPALYFGMFTWEELAVRLSFSDKSVG